MNIKKIGNILFWIIILGMIFYSANSFYNRYRTKADIEKELKAKSENIQNNDTKNLGKPKAYDFSLKDIEGKTVKLSDYRGKIVILNFWATWCPPCRSEIPELVKASEQLKKGEDAVILGVSLANGYNGETPERVKKFVKENNMTMKVLLDEKDEAAQEYRIKSIPTTFIINRDGTIYDFKLQPISYKEIMDIVDKIK